MRLAVRLLPVASAVWFLVTIVWAGYGYPNYQHGTQFISELGAKGAPHGQVVNFFGFIPTSLLLGLFVIIATTKLVQRRQQRLGLFCLGIYALTLAIAAFFPCDLGCRPEHPSTSQLIHNLSTVPGYFLGIVGVFVLAIDLKRGDNSSLLSAVGIGLGSCATVLFFLLNPGFPFVGLTQRLFETSIYIWTILYGLHLTRNQG
jgi:hypothetical membrane protein